jgi:hypothetical protein
MAGHTYRYSGAVSGWLDKLYIGTLVPVSGWLDTLYIGTVVPVSGWLDTLCIGTLVAVSGWLDMLYRVSREECARLRKGVP